LVFNPAGKRVPTTSVGIAVQTVASCLPSMNMFSRSSRVAQDPAAKGGKGKTLPRT